MTFRDKVYEVVAKIPSGSVMNYEEVATAAGTPTAGELKGNEKC